MTIGVGITTAPRPVPTLEQSYRSLRDVAGHDGFVLISSDDDHFVVADDWHTKTVFNAPRLGEFPNYTMTLRRLLGVSTADWLLILQDDVLWARGSMAALANELPKFDGKAVGFLSLYCPVKVSNGLSVLHGSRLKPGWHVSRLGIKTTGAQAFMFPRKSAERMLDDKLFRKCHADQYPNIDRAIPMCMLSLGLPGYYRVPCLVNHELGAANSSLKVKVERRSMQTDYFTGRP